MWIPVPDAYRLSRLLIVDGRYVKICWYSWSWLISLFLIITNRFVSKHVLIQYMVTSVKPSG